MHVESFPIVIPPGHILGGKVTVSPNVFKEVITIRLKWKEKD